MKKLHPVIAREYKKWRDAIGESEPYKEDGVLGIYDVLRAHYLIADYFVN